MGSLSQYVKQRCQSFLTSDVAKLGTKKARWKQKSIGREFVGVLVGVLPFFGTLVGVFVFLVGVLIPLVGVWWEFLSDLFFLP